MWVCWVGVGVDGLPGQMEGPCEGGGGWWWWGGGGWWVVGGGGGAAAGGLCRGTQQAVGMVTKTTAPAPKSRAGVARSGRSVEGRPRGAGVPPKKDDTVLLQGDGAGGRGEVHLLSCAERQAVQAPALHPQAVGTRGARQAGTRMRPLLLGAAAAAVAAAAGTQRRRRASRAAGPAAPGPCRASRAVPAAPRHSSANGPAAPAPATAAAARPGRESR